MAGNTLARTGLFGSFLSLVAAACCVLPLVFIILGFGGAWLSVFGVIAAGAYYVVAATAAIIVLGFYIAIRRQASGRTYGLLFLGAALTVVAWLVILNETVINSFLIELT